MSINTRTLKSSLFANSHSADGNYKIKVKEIVDENFQDYKKSSMMIACTKCDFKCFTELGLKPDICQNMMVAQKKSIEVSLSDIFYRYKSNLITNAVVIGGLEPMLQFGEFYNLIGYFRKNNCYDDFVIYTGYYEDEIAEELSLLRGLENIIVKFGRFIPNSKKVFDNVLGIYLASDNQYAERIC